MIRVVLSAYACEPGRGSEPGVGWNVARELSSRVSLRVVTRANNRPVIENSGEPWIHDVEWIYWDPPKWASFWKKGNRGVQLFYILWQWGIKEVVRKSLENEDADIIHHLTFGKYWIPSRLAALGRPFVFGPVGGGERTPPGFDVNCSVGGRIAETVKSALTWSIVRIPACLRLLRKAAWTFAATPQTQAVLQRAGVTNISVLPQSGIGPSDLPDLHAPTQSSAEGDSELVFITAARLIHWKAIDLAIEALALASQQHKVKLVVLQTGSELPALRKLSAQLGVDNIVEFKGRLPSLQMVHQEISRADALIHPALHEAFGQACIESLALGVPVICLDWGGPGMIVDPTSGIKISPSNRQTTVKALADAMVKIRELKASGKITAASCTARAHENFSWCHLADAIVTRYHDAMRHTKHDASP